ncbi:PREDICTED: E3 ubiquitin-protein ligase MIB2-like [Nicotiana attenuata]|uniref:Uncharacterized protein n=1 Tax=Nicotiana attenuata TaxID=49451 RepID=A0A1J6ILN8_NICAT|nr:PREDICTED: E3 ubiquitin-protein ligase MIB2-like [Nicotiana attenuata]OIS99794.1 hypothetical protein A4A49_28685 [Nicotiana attenuata]
MAVMSTEQIFFSKAYILSSDNDIEESLALVREEGFISLNQRCDTMLHFLAIEGNVAAFRALIEEGLLGREALRKKNVKGCTSLHEAARYGEKEVAEIMLMQDIDLAHLKDEARETPLYKAAEYGKDEVFRLLEDFGSDCFAKRNDGCTVLHAAVDGEHYRMLANLIQRG